MLASEDERSGLQLHGQDGTGAIGVDVYYWFHGDALFRGEHEDCSPRTDSLHVDMLRILTEKYGPPIREGRP